MGFVRRLTRVALIRLLLTFAALVAAYTTVGHATNVWPPKGVTRDVYTGNMLAITVIMSLVTVEWAYYAVKKGDPAQGVWGLLITAGFGSGFVLLLWQLGSKLGYGPGTTKYGAFPVLFFSMLAASGAVALLGIAAIVLVIPRILSRQVTADNAEMLRAVCWVWDFVVVAWLMVYACVWLFTA